LNGDNNLAIAEYNPVYLDGGEYRPIYQAEIIMTVLFSWPGDGTLLGQARVLFS
jgi:hypothetical protein